MIEKFKRYLKSKRMRLTPERLRIAEIAISLKDGFSLSTLECSLRERNFPVSKSTVSRTLPLLFDAGLVRVKLIPETCKLAFVPVPTKNNTKSVYCVNCYFQASINSTAEKSLSRFLSALYPFDTISLKEFRAEGRCRNCVDQARIDDSKD